MWSTVKASTEHQPQDRSDVWFSKDFKAAIWYKEYEENMFKIFKEHKLFNVWAKCLSRKTNYIKKKKTQKKFWK